MLWPLADRPRLAAGVPGGTTPVRLIDDELATSLAAGGRLDMLLAAAEFATSRDVDPDGEVSRSMCLAVDPDLLVTVNAMTGGYVGPTAPDARPSNPGRRRTREPGRTRRSNWLNRLRTLAQRMCVAPLPYAQADLDALQRVGDAGLSAIATSSRRRHRRPDPRRHLGPRRHPRRRRLADPPRRGPAERQRPNRGDRRRRLVAQKTPPTPRRRR